MLPEELSLRLAVICAGLACAGAASGALAAAGGKDPKTLVLQQADMPAGAVRGPSYSAPGGGKDYFTTFNFRVGTREEVVSSEASVSLTEARAAQWYGLLVAEGSDPTASALSLPAYGQVQHSSYVAKVGRGQLVVRERTVVWRLTVESCSYLSPAGCLYGRTPPKLTAAQALAELRKYAPRQKARVGNA